MAKREMPEMGRFERGRTDPYTGATWIYVTRAMAHAHPKGQLNVILYLIVLYLAVLGAGKLGLMINGNLGSGSLWFSIVTLGSGILSLLTALGLYFRVPWSVILATALIAFPILGFSQSLARGSAIYSVIELCFLVVSLIYLLDGERPNLIYRYRYRAHGDGDENGATPEDR